MSSATYLLALLLSAQATAGTTVERTDTLAVQVTDEEAGAVAGAEVFVLDRENTPRRRVRLTRQIASFAGASQGRAPVKAVPRSRAQSQLQSRLCVPAGAAVLYLSGTQTQSGHRRG